MCVCVCVHACVYTCVCVRVHVRVRVHVCGVCSAVCQVRVKVIHGITLVNTNHGWSILRTLIINKDVDENYNQHSIMLMQQKLTLCQ